MVAIGAIGAGMLALAGYSTGAFFLLRRKRRVLQLQAMERLLSSIRDEIEYRNMPVADILELLREDSALSILYLQNCEELHCLQMPAELTPEQKDCFQSALAEVGLRTCEESVRSLLYYQNKAQFFVREETALLTKAEKTYRQIGLCVGLLAALVLI